jgi:tellurium resistance protein TerZ
MAVNLVKGQKISLKKENGNSLTSFCVGANWGKIEKRGFFGGLKKEAVDLDLSVALFDSNKNLVDVVYYGNLQVSGVKHSGDDLVGDDEDDGLDNEVIQVNLPQLNPNVEQIVFILNSFKGQDFATIPYASIRLYEGTPDRVNEVFATYEVAKEPQFAGYVSMVLGKLYKRNGEWKFSAIGEPTKDRKLQDTINTVAQKYL